jgi:hypothetical protein
LDLQGKRGRGRPKKETQDHPLLVRLPADHYEYLEYLVTVKRRLGTSATAAATYILIRELDKMMRTKYHEKGWPPEER